MRKKTTALDLFRGAGGWSVASRSLGIHEDGCDNMKQANATAQAAGFNTLFEDVLAPPRLFAREEYNGLIASPPCQTFSQAGSGAGRQALDQVLELIGTPASWKYLNILADAAKLLGDARTALVLTPLHYWFRLHPEWVAFEQVPTVLPVWEAMKPVMEEAGYDVWTGYCFSEQYGVPQTRKRAFLIASRTKSVSKPEASHSKFYNRDVTRLDSGVLPWVSMGQALGWPEDLTMRSNYGTGEDPAKRGERTFSQPAPAITSKIDRNVVYRTTPMVNATVRELDQPAPTVMMGHEIPRWVHQRPSPTIVGSFHPEVVAAPGYRTTVSRQPDSVRVTVQEAGILQSFPPDYPWFGAVGKQYLQVGNACPPLLAEAVLSEATGIQRVSGF